LVKNGQDNRWRLNRQVNLTVLIQLFFLASLIVGTWVNLQSRLSLLQRDVNMLIESNTHFQNRVEVLAERTIAFEYRIKVLEK